MGKRQKEIRKGNPKRLRIATLNDKKNSSVECTV
jgi:hypothetical protein